LLKFQRKALTSMDLGGSLITKNRL